MALECLDSWTVWSKQWTILVNNQTVKLEKHYQYNRQLSLHMTILDSFKLAINKTRSLSRLETRLSISLFCKTVSRDSRVATGRSLSFLISGVAPAQCALPRSFGKGTFHTTPLPHIRNLRIRFPCAFHRFPKCINKNAQFQQIESKSDWQSSSTEAYVGQDRGFCKSWRMPRFLRKQEKPTWLCYLHYLIRFAGSTAPIPYPAIYYFPPTDQSI